ncbi:hypothetical protein VDG05_16880 [Xanthomonas campestris pv. raphani]|uniref:hypothetical protein n=1 Tax=Xanthomonas campestris TaxID=339 RepID=UPI002B238FEA|nr:hypothetical protein [Xanthomonas campestris]MEA9885984.1 hypothetical protein [Xanthomonas campestris pv. raphani]
MDSELLIKELGGTAAVARLFDIKSPSVSEWKRTGIPKARMQTLRLLRPDLLGHKAAESAGRVDVTKRALRAKLGLSNDAGLAVLLKLPRDQVEAWGEDEHLPALPTVLALVATQPTKEPKAPSDVDAERIVPVEVA